MKVKSIAECIKRELVLKPTFVFFLSGRLRQDLL